MQKITLLIFVFTFFITQAQNTTTGLITLTPNFTVQFDVDGPNDTVTMTMVGPSNVWLGVALDTNSGNGMGSGGEDVILFLGNEIKDASLTGFTQAPPYDTLQDWTLVSITPNGNSTTVVATRELNTNDPDDYVFTTNVGSIPLIWAYGSSFTLNGHVNRGGAQGNFILNTNDLYKTEFEVFPNPTISELNFEFPQNIQSVNVKVYNVLGNQIMQTTLKKSYPKLNTNTWASGMYVIQVVTENEVQTKRVLKQ